jgi:uncharacterized protein (DUF1015 family)
MAIIAPFRALRYDPDVVPTELVVTQPYDKITPAMQERYYDSSPYNLVRLILGKHQPDDNERQNVYSRAAAALASWRKEGVLKRDPEPSIYAYEQRFTVPGDPLEAHHTRTGFVALLRLEDYSNGVVFRHEQTLSKPKADRLNLLRATRVHAGQIFLVYDGDGRPLASHPVQPTVELRDEYGVEHSLWRISDREVIRRIVEQMASRRAIIADGHHRYETALAFRNEQRERAAAAGSSSTSAAVSDAPHEFVMATFIDMNSPGLTILPTHRVVHGLEHFETGDFVERTRAHFMFQDVSSLMPRIGGNGPHFDPAIAQKLLTCQIRGSSVLSEERLPAPQDVIMLAVTAESTFLLYSKPTWADSILADLPPLERQLDVVQLHKIILEKVLGMSEADIREQRHISYVRDPAEAVEQVKAGANVAVLMNPVRMDQMRDIAFGGGVLPQKSTDFYPKLLSGLAIYALD